MAGSSSQTLSADMPSAGEVLKRREEESIVGQNDRIKKRTSGKKGFFEVLKGIAKN